MRDISYIFIEDWKKYGVIAGITTRKGGFSKGSYDSFNLGRNTGDHIDIINKNLDKFLTELSLKKLYTQNKIMFTNQIHKDEIKIIDDKAVENNNSNECFIGTDGFITKLIGKNRVVLTIITADCQPIFLLDKENRYIGLLHAGWKGTKLKIIKKGISLLVEEFKSKKENILVHLGPCIKQHNYEVSAVFKEYFNKNLLYKSGKYYFDISQENRDIAISSGIPESNIFDFNLCTYDNSDLFYSYRRDNGKTGRMLSFITVE